MKKFGHSLSKTAPIHQNSVISPQKCLLNPNTNHWLLRGANCIPLYNDDIIERRIGRVAIAGIPSQYRKGGNPNTPKKHK
jgi:hypothetical protein